MFFPDVFPGEFRRVSYFAIASSNFDKEKADLMKSLLGGVSVIKSKCCNDSINPEYQFF
ncbi:hypothetical protein [Halomonas halocynthiae]|uniref:hypothetical protein n=1 Tax=Halomonas halocynthiae TaxID=176290 RepID=UPI000405C0ED|nr:hypothetical protein [Halomonas halocynthiae]